MTRLQFLGSLFSGAVTALMPWKAKAAVLPQESVDALAASFDRNLNVLHNQGYERCVVIRNNGWRDTPVGSMVYYSPTSYSQTAGRGCRSLPERNGVT